MMYIQSVYTGQVYAVDTLPKFGGYEVISEATYNKIIAERGF